MADRPPGFAVTFRTPEPSSAEDDVYQQALALTAIVEQILVRAELARFQLKSRLDHDATHIALWLGQAARELAPAERRRLYRQARPLAIECGTLLDIIEQRAPGIETPLIDRARTMAAGLALRLEHLSAH